MPLIWLNGSEAPSLALCRTDLLAGSSTHRRAATHTVSTAGVTAQSYVTATAWDAAVQSPTAQRVGFLYFWRHQLRKGLPWDAAVIAQPLRSVTCTRRCICRTRTRWGCRAAWCSSRNRSLRCPLSHNDVFELHHRIGNVDRAFKTPCLLLVEVGLNFLPGFLLGCRSHITRLDINQNPSKMASEIKYLHGLFSSLVGRSPGPHCVLTAVLRWHGWSWP